MSYGKGTKMKDALGILEILSAGLDLSSLGSIMDLAELPIQLQEIERKYLLTNDSDLSPPIVFADFTSRLHRLLSDQSIIVEDLLIFSGVDEYYGICRGSDRYWFRYRVGAMRAPELTVKFQVVKGDNSLRNEINLRLRVQDTRNARALLAVITKLTDSHKHFVVQASGNIWIFRERDTKRRFEVVAYKTDSVYPPKGLKVFAEIEALDVADIESGLELIGRYEKVLNIAEFRCSKSMAEIFSEE